MRLREALALSGVLLGLGGPAAASAAVLTSGPGAAAAPQVASAVAAAPVASPPSAPPRTGPTPGTRTGAAAPAPAPAPGAGTRDVGAGAGAGAKPAPALPARLRAAECGEGKSTEFPIGARIRGGPAVYRSGGGPQSWYLDLANTGPAPCTAVHPVVVFTDSARALRPEHLRMEFDTAGGTYPVSMERTDRDEVIAVFDGGSAFPGFSVAPGATVTVKVGLSFDRGAPAGEVVADAALVQRKGDDGEWIGESGGYRFSVDGPDESAEGASEGAGRSGEAPETGEAGALADTGTDTGTSTGTGAGEGTGRAAGGAGDDGAAAAVDRARERARWVTAGLAGAALAAGGGLLLFARRLRTTP
ncbi:hypothetical protein [Streptomyces sp. NPDC048603]|uniref:hypothetical protein n=1 Tax=Streptomyces sp. NPDC048603 TaxID=3365577 RepID=UPI003719B258